MKTVVYVWHKALLVVYARKDLGSVIAVMMLWSTFLNVFQHVSFPWSAKLPSLHAPVSAWKTGKAAIGLHSVLAREGEKKGKGGQGSEREGRVVPF